jgi:uncharacterized protein YdcH (DUF465 family)
MTQEEERLRAENAALNSANSVLTSMLTEADAKIARLEEESRLWDKASLVKLLQERDQLREELARAQEMLADTQSALNEHMDTYNQTVNELRDARAARAVALKEAALLLEESMLPGARLAMRDDIIDYIREQAKIAELEGRP